MKKIVVIDDTPFWRDMTADTLRRNGYEVHTAPDGVEGLNLMGLQNPDLVILDVEMPQMEGFAFLTQMRHRKEWKNTPVIMLTGDMQKDHILRARGLGAADYLLKARFSPKELLERVTTRLSASQSQPVTQPILPSTRASVLTGGTSPVRGAAIAVPQDATHIESARPAPVMRQSNESVLQALKKFPAPSLATIPRLLTVEQCKERIQQAMNGRTLSGIVAEVISLTSSTRSDLSDLAKMIMRDPILSARVLQAANSAANTASRGHVSSIQEAVRNIGCAAVRNIAVTLGIFDAMPPAESDGFNPIRCWQHSFAVATLCQLWAPPKEGGIAYLMGLCHDLGEILLRSHFGPEYGQVLSARETTCEPLQIIERTVLGMTHSELAETILNSLGLPTEISAPITEYLQTGLNGRLIGRRAILLKMADLYANGLLLTASDQSVVAPLNRGEVRMATGQDQVPVPDALVLRAEVFSLTAMLANLPPKERLQLTKAFYATKAIQIWLARDASLSSCDPISAAAQSLAEVKIENRLPNHEELETYRGLIVVGRSTTVPGFTADAISKLNAERSLKSPTSILWLVGRVAEGAAESRSPALTYPISLHQMAQFVSGL